MNLRPALRAFVESSHSSFYPPIALVTDSSVFLAQLSSSPNSERHSFIRRSLSSLPVESIHLSPALYVHSSTFSRCRFGRFVVSPAAEFRSNFDRSSICDLLASSVARQFRSSAFSAASAMSRVSETSLQTLSLQSTDPHTQSLPTDADDSKIGDEGVKEEVLVQYIVIRKDLVSEQNWPLGSIISQGCHAAVAAIWLYKEDPETALYCRPENLDHMHKVTLEVKGETQLRNLAQKLETAGIAHKLWIEQPENYATCLATKPYHKSQVAPHFKKLKLCK